MQAVQGMQCIVQQNATFQNQHMSCLRAGHLPKKEAYIDQHVACGAHVGKVLSIPCICGCRILNAYMSSGLQQLGSFALGY